MSKPCTPARLKAISDRANLRVMAIARRYRHARSEFPEIDAFIARHRQFAERAWLAFVIAEGVIVKRSIDAFEAAQLYGI